MKIGSVPGGSFRIHAVFLPLLWAWAAPGAPCNFLVLRDGSTLKGKIQMLSDGAVTLEGDPYFYRPKDLARICREETLEQAAEMWTFELKGADPKTIGDGWLYMAKFQMRQREEKLSLQAAEMWAEARGWKAYASTYFLILTDSAPRRVEEVRTRLDAIFKRFQADFKPKAAPGRESVVRLFKDDFGYRNYCSQVGISGAGAFYDPELGELVLRDYSEIDKGMTFQAVYHEANHQYMAEHFLKRQQVRTWISEGLAGYYETAVFRNKRITEIGKVHREHMDEVRQALRDGTMEPLESFLRMERRQFYGNDPRRLNYPQAWALVHFFLHTKDKSMREAFWNYLEHYRETGKDEEAFDTTFGALGVPKIEEAWKGYMRTLR